MRDSGVVGSRRQEPRVERSTALRGMVEAIESLAGDLHLCDRQDRAPAILDCIAAGAPPPRNGAALRFAAPGHAAAHCRAAVRQACSRAPKRHLQTDVATGLIEIGRSGLPADPHRFIASAYMLCAILRRDIGFRDKAVQPTFAGFGPTARAEAELPC